jgi:hypothetical protein
VGVYIVSNCYSLYSFVTSVTAWPELMAAIDARLAPFAVEDSAWPDLTVAFRPANRQGQPFADPPGRRVYDFTGGHVNYDDAGRRLTVAVGDRIRASCDPAAGQAHVVIDSPRASDLYVLSHPVVSLLLMELLKARGLYPLHAAGLAVDGRGVLLAGTSGAGKSTLSLAMARRGFSFLSDDTVYMDRDACGWRVHAFPDQIDLCADTVEMFPELLHVADAPVPPGWRKRQVRAEAVYGSTITWHAPARVLIFPSVSGKATSAIRPLSPQEALFELAPNVLLTDITRSQQHLDALAGLVSQCACYHLDTGRDLDEAVEVVREAVA